MKSGWNGLRELGLNKAEANCYQSLYQGGDCGAAELAARLHKSPSNLYRSLNRLAEKGFVTKAERITRQAVHDLLIDERKRIQERKRFNKRGYE